MIVGTCVQFSDAYKVILSISGCDDHLKEFGKLTGIVQGSTKYHTSEGPEVDVKWSNGFIFAYHPRDLEETKPKKTK